MGLEYGNCLLVKYDEDALRDPSSEEGSKDRSEDPRAPSEPSSSVFDSLEAAGLIA